MEQGPTRALVFQGVVVDPVHIVDELEIVDPVGTNRPKVFGRLGRPGIGELKSAKERLCSSSGLGWK